jgi:hypothetical protein
MFKLTDLPVQSVRNDPVRLPISALLLVPNNPSISTSPFNLPAAVNHLMGGSGWERATKVMRPRIWAPGWSDEKLSAFVRAPFATAKHPFPPEAVPNLRTAVFPPMTGRVDMNHEWPQYEVIHTLNNYAIAGMADEPVFRLALERGFVQSDDFLAGRVLAAGALRDVLVAVGTRLMILQVASFSAANAAELGRYVVGGGGPAAVVVVSGGTPEGLEAYFLGLYANIIHNLPMRVVAKPGETAGAPEVELIISQNGDDILRLDRWMQQLNDLIDQVQAADRRILVDVIGDRTRLLHTAQLDRLKRRVYEQALGEGALAFVDNLARLDNLRDKINWTHETGGAIPLSEAAESAPTLQAAARALRGLPPQYPALEAELEAMTATAPRVLNANFGDPGRGKLLEMDETLVASQSYELLVDVGPRWNTVPSLVTGSDAFPEDALPPGQDGYRVRVVLFSNDFVASEAGSTSAETSVESAKPRDVRRPDFEVVTTPPLEATKFDAFTSEYRTAVGSAEIWVPRGSGRSYPMNNGQRAEQSGPVRLRVRAPDMPANSPDRVEARGRLSLYYEGNLLQSAVVRISIARDAARLPGLVENSVHVDYVLSGGFTELDKFDTRRLGNDAESTCPVGLNISMNDDGASGHRLMVDNRTDLSVWRPYDPAAAEGLLQIARDKLKECFWERDSNCCVAESDESRRRDALNADNGKTLAQFKCDLFQLAWYGSDLYTQAFGQLSMPNLLAFLRRFQQALASRTVIQIARTGIAQYVYPWAMLYDIPLPNRNIPDRLRYCDVLKKEWEPEAHRAGPAKEKCPYHTDEDYDVLCPYGFWGLKHYIEQPINVQPKEPPAPGSSNRLPPDAVSTVRVKQPMNLAVAVTRDVDPKALQTHLNRIQQLASCTPSGGADDWDQVCAALSEPDLVYFLCHGEYDGRDPYLGIGPPDNDSRHRVYPGNLFQWALTQRRFWPEQDRHPLVFINGCHTADLKPGEILNFVTTFANFGASAVVGTEIGIRLPLATEIAQNFLKRVIINGQAVGAAMHELRWELANKGNLLGLAYTPYSMSNLVFQTQLDR